MVKWLIKRLFCWTVLLLSISLLYYFSWGHYEYLPEDSRQLEFLEQQKLQGELKPLEESGIIDERLFQAQTNSGNHYWYYKRFKDAERLFKNRIETSSTLWGPRSEQTYHCISDLAALNRDWNKFKEADQGYRQLLSMDQDRQANSITIARDLNNLGVLYCLWGQSLPNMTKRRQKFAQSESLYNDCLTKLNKDQASQLYQMALRNRAVVRKEMGKLTDAESDEQLAASANK